jgi:dTDP-4-amino-4,6-dideoxygalactose transaminase
MGELREIARRHGIRLIEDACQAHGAKLNIAERWINAGTVGDAGCFSFYPGKNLGGWGEGGAIATNDDALAAAASRLRDHGRVSHYAHDAIGYNARLDAIQAAVLRAKLERLSEWNERRRTAAARYRELLSQSDLVLPHEPEGAQSCYHLFVVRSPKRDAIRQALTQAEIESGVHYPIPLHLQPACRFLGYRQGDFPVSEEVANTVLSLPMHPHLTRDHQDAVAGAVCEALARA